MRPCWYARHRAGRHACWRGGAEVCAALPLLHKLAKPVLAAGEQGAQGISPCSHALVLRGLVRAGCGRAPSHRAARLRGRARRRAQVLWSDIDYMDGFRDFTLNPVAYAASKMQARPLMARAMLAASRQGEWAARRRVWRDCLAAWCARLAMRCTRLGPRSPALPSACLPTPAAWPQAGSGCPATCAPCHTPSHMEGVAAPLCGASVLTVSQGQG